MALLAPRSRRRTSSMIRPDGRTIAVRRYRTLVREFEAEIGGGVLSASDRVLLEQAAGLVVRSEAIQTAIVAGLDTDASEAIRLASESRRILHALKAAGGKNKPARPLTIRERLLLESSSA
jgi:hypothetical protein